MKRLLKGSIDPEAKGEDGKDEQREKETALGLIALLVFQLATAEFLHEFFFPLAPNEVRGRRQGLHLFLYGHALTLGPVLNKIFQLGNLFS